VTPGVPSILKALARRAERDGRAQPLPARLLRDAAEALLDLAYIGEHGGAWEQRIARDGPATRTAAVEERRK
jgi:hypothetical protein